MVEKRLFGQGENVVLQVLQVFDSGHHLHGFRIAENEIAESEIAGDEVFQLSIHILRAFVDEGCSALTCIFTSRSLRRLHDERHILVGLSDFGKQLESRQVVFHPVFRKTAVADHSKHVLLVFVVELPCLLIVSGQHDFWTSTHPESLQLRVERLSGKQETLLEHEIVEARQDGRIESDGVLHKHDHLHSRLDVVVEIHLVLNEFDDGEEQFCVAQPAEHILKYGKVLILHPLCDAMAEWGEDHNRDFLVFRLDFASDVEHVAASGSRHADDEFKSGAFQFLFRFGE